LLPPQLEGGASLPNQPVVVGVDDVVEETGPVIDVGVLEVEALFGTKEFSSNARPTTKATATIAPIAILPAYSDIFYFATAIPGRPYAIVLEFRRAPSMKYFDKSDRFLPKKIELSHALGELLPLLIQEP
jgi:hypothetical protein